MNHSQKVQSHFNAIVSSYRENFSDSKSGRNFEFRKRLQIVTDMLNGRKGSLLECACGTGEITRAVLNTGAYEKAVICDISSEMLAYTAHAIASPASANIEFINSEIFAFLEKETRQFDVIMCLGLIAHTGNLEKMLGLLKARLTPGGCLILQSSLAEHCNIKLTRFLSGKRLDRKIGYPMQYFTYGDIQKTVDKTGLTITSAKRYTFGLPYGDKLCAQINYHVEKALEKASEKCGSECIMLIEHA